MTLLKPQRLIKVEASVRGQGADFEKKNPEKEPWEVEAIRLCQRGEKEPFARLVDHYKNWVFGLMFRWVGKKEVAEEMAQEVFLKAYSRIGSFRGEAKFSTWLYQICFNRCRDYWRSREFHQAAYEPLEQVEEKPALSPHAEQEVMSRQQERSVRRALESLPEIYREAVMLRYLHELSYEEMAEQLDLGVSSLKMRVLRGLNLLKNKLGGQGDG